MPNNSAGNFVSNVAAAIVGGGLVSGLALATPAIREEIGAALTTLLWITLIAIGIGFYLAYDYYVDVLASGSKAQESRERKAYDRLRENLVKGGLPSQLYIDRLTAFLDAVDRFFGDANIPDRTFFPHAFGLRTPAPLWTAPAFDRCLQLALVYPIAIIFLVWAVSGHVGPAERALGLGAGFPFLRRVVSLSLAGIVTITTRRAIARPGWKSVGWIVGAILAGVGAAKVAGGAAIAFVAILAAAGAATALGALVVITMAGAFSFSLTVVSLIALIGIAAITVIVFVRLLKWSVEHGRQGVFLIVLFVLMLCLCLSAALILSPRHGWYLGGPLFLFFGLLTLLNAPFDWASLGVTRALLRRGMEMGGWWPYALALIDAALAVLVIAILAATMIVGVQAFELMIQIGHGQSVLLVSPMLNGVEAHPAAPEFWWIYALLLSTMIPSLVNLVIGGASFVRGIPSIPSLLLRYMPVGKAVSVIDRNWVALVLTSQWLIGAVLGIAAQAVLIWLFFGKLMPLAGIDLLDAARWLAALNIPERVYQLFT